jgi:hypothetical protein
MRERASRVNGTFDFDSAGTTRHRIRLVIPVDNRQCCGAVCRPSLAAIVTRSGSESAFILRIT